MRASYFAFTLLFVFLASLTSQAQPWSTSGTSIYYNGGNVGIGTASPAAALNVAGGAIVASYPSTGTLAGFVELWDDNALIWYNNNGNQGFRFGSASDFNATNFSEKMRITNAGNLLIGKTSQVNSTYMLDVNGSARANTVVVNTTGADYVFDSVYQLRSLDAVEAYIKRQHHLPDIAPAKEMREQGLDLGGNQTVLLKKIEELTLYAIDQQKQLQTQAKQINILAQQNEKLENLQLEVDTLKAMLKKLVEK